MRDASLPPASTQAVIPRYIHFFFNKKPFVMSEPQDFFIQLFWGGFTKLLHFLDLKKNEAGTALSYFLVSRKNQAGRFS